MLRLPVRRLWRLRIQEVDSDYERRRPKDARHLTRLKHLVLADKAEGAPLGALSFPWRGVSPSA